MVEKRAGGRFHPTQLDGLNLSIPAEVGWLGALPEIVRILPSGRRLRQIELLDAQIEAELLLGIERATFGLYELPPQHAAA